MTFTSDAKVFFYDVCISYISLRVNSLYIGSVQFPAGSQVRRKISALVVLIECSRQQSACHCSVLMQSLLHCYKYLIFLVAYILRRFGQRIVVGYM